MRRPSHNNLLWQIKACTNEIVKWDDLRYSRRAWVFHNHSNFRVLAVTSKRSSKLNHTETHPSLGWDIFSVYDDLVPYKTEFQLSRHPAWSTKMANLMPTQAPSTIGGYINLGKGALVSLTSSSRRSNSMRRIESLSVVAEWSGSRFDVVHQLIIIIVSRLRQLIRRFHCLNKGSHEHETSSYWHHTAASQQWVSYQCCSLQQWLHQQH